MAGEQPDAGAPQDSAPARELAQQEIATPAPGPPPAERFFARRGVDFELGDNLFNPARFRPYRRSESADPLYRPLRIYTRDPIRSRYAGAETVINIRFEPLSPGPEGALLLVADEELAGVDEHGVRRHRSYPGVDLDARTELINRGRTPSPGDIFFHQQMVYAVTAKVIERFTLALGRDPSWGFHRITANGVKVRRPDAAAATLPADAAGDKLRLRPHYSGEANAYYDSVSGELRFGYFTAAADAGTATLPRGTIYSCLSQDIIAHEMAHALLDGMRGRFTDPTNPDVLALHEAFADLVAILQHCGNVESMRRALKDTAGKLDAAQLFTLAEQFGWATGARGALRVLDPDQDYFEAGDQPHQRGEVLSAAILDAVVTVYDRRVEKLRRLWTLTEMPSTATLDGDYLDLLAETASKVAGHFLGLAIRAIDYCPPVDITFGEYLRALVTADRDLVEDDRWGYRDALIAAFGRRRIFPSDVGDLSEESLLWRAPSRPLPPINRLDMANVAFNADPSISVDAREIEAQTQALADFITDPRYAREFGLLVRGDPDYVDTEIGLPVIESIRTIRRVGPDRQVRFGLVAEVLQAAKLEIAGQPIDMVGGATIILGGAGDVRFVIRKRLKQAERARRQANYQASGTGRYQANAARAGYLWAKLHEVAAAGR